MEPQVTQEVEAQTVRAPIVENGGQVIYQVTLARGLVLTGPQYFEDLSEAGPWSSGPVFAEDGRLLAPSRTG